jgi:hypothetical protein
VKWISIGVSMHLQNKKIITSIITKMEIQTIINKMRKKKIQKNNRTNRINQEIGKDGKMRLNKQ